ncbi:MAG: hypothetical protein ACK559_21625 [bacterium]
MPRTVEAAPSSSDPRTHTMFHDPAGSERPSSASPTSPSTTSAPTPVSRPGSPSPS